MMNMIHIINDELSLTDSNDRNISVKNIIDIIKEPIVNINSDYTVNGNEYIVADTTNAAVSVTLPATPEVNLIIKFLDGKGTFDSNSLSVVRNGNTIMGKDEDMVVNTKNISFGLMFTNNDWRIV